MATDIVFGPAPPPHLSHARLSISSSSHNSPSSSESPQTASTFSFVVRYPTTNSSPTTDDIIPKIEELDEDDVDDVKTLPAVEESPISPTRAVAKRPRGRPRKHPLNSPTAITKPPKGRSKTGCITCRRRKKKCDETKPHCMHTSSIIFCWR